MISFPSFFPSDVSLIFVQTAIVSWLVVLNIWSQLYSYHLTKHLACVTWLARRQTICATVSIKLMFSRLHSLITTSLECTQDDQAILSRGLQCAWSQGLTVTLQASIFMIHYKGARRGPSPMVCYRYVFTLWKLALPIYPTSSKCVENGWICRAKEVSLGIVWEYNEQCPILVCEGGTANQSSLCAMCTRYYIHAMPSPNSQLELYPL